MEKQSFSKQWAVLVVIALFPVFLYACAQMQAKPPEVAAPLEAPVEVALAAPDPALELYEDPTSLPEPGPPFALHNRNPEVVLKDFPLDAVQNEDWVKALLDKKIHPLGSLDPNKREMPPLDFNVDIPAVGSMPDVVFPHKAHTLWLQCSNCHPGIFAMRKGANPISMVKIVNGEFCGKCHGRVAFPLANCTRCHVKPKEAAAP